MLFLMAPNKIEAAKGKKLLHCIKMELGEPDRSGRRRPVPIEGSEEAIEVDTIIGAIGQSTNTQFLYNDFPVKLNKWGDIEINGNTFQTSEMNIFAGGDCVTGPATVIQAVAAGHRAAESINNYLMKGYVKEHSVDYSCSRGTMEDLPRWEFEKMPKISRAPMPSISLEDRKNNFNEVDLGYEYVRCQPMQLKTEMQQGWEFATGIMGADIAAHMGQEYVSAVEAAIKQLEENINNHQYRNLGIGQLQGYMLEEWGAGTFNVDAVAADSADRASVLHSTLKDSVDIQLDSGETYSAKSYVTAEKTAKAQARFSPESGHASYHDQGRLVPSDQLSDAKATAHREALRNQPIRSDVSDAYAETESRLTDTIKNEKGVSSKSASRKELEDIAHESKEQKFKAEDHGVTADSAINTEYMLKQALKAGYTTAAITVAFQLAPEIYKAIDFLIKHGEIDIQQIKRMGTKGISAGAEGFLRGSISSSLLIMCEKGVLGEAFKGINPTVLGTVVALVMQTVKNSILVAAGKMSTQQMGAAFVDTVVISGGYLLGAHIGGIIGQALGFELPVVGYLLGSLIGTSFCVIYNIGKKKLISFCVDTGFTCFGLVEQNYELPDEVLHELGVKTIPIPRTQIERIDIPRTQTSTADINKSEYETIDITVLRRGVIGVNKIGYVMT